MITIITTTTDYPRATGIAVGLRHGVMTPSWTCGGEPQWGSVARKLAYEQACRELMQDLQVLQDLLVGQGISLGAPVNYRGFSGWSIGFWDLPAARAMAEVDLVPQPDPEGPVPSAVRVWTRREVHTRKGQVWGGSREEVGIQVREDLVLIFGVIGLEEGRTRAYLTRIESGVDSTNWVEYSPEEVVATTWWGAISRQVVREGFNVEAPGFAPVLGGAEPDPGLAPVLGGR